MKKGQNKRECHHGRRFTSREEPAQMIRELFANYNNRRIQRNLGVLTPIGKLCNYPLVTQKLPETQTG